MRRKNLLFLSIKVVLFILSIALLLLPFALQIHHYQVKYEPRTSLLTNSDINGYSFVLLGDSAFASFYVNNDNDSIWQKFESFTGNKCFSGALNGAKEADFINAAKYITYKMPANSTVFIDILPTRFAMHTRLEKGNYESEFAEVLIKEKFKILKYYDYLNLNYLEYLNRISQGKKTDRPLSNGYNRIWSVDGDLAKNTYHLFVSEFSKVESDPSNEIASEEIKLFFDDITSIFRKTKIKVVFVLMPLNKTQIYTYSDNQQADLIYFKLKNVNEKIKIHLKKINASYIDLFESIPDNCFADLFHTNAGGDEIIAKSLADYVSSERK
jgi:hypothetical protein